MEKISIKRYVMGAIFLIGIIAILGMVANANATLDKAGAITDAAGRLMALQGSDGGWDWNITGLTSHSLNPSADNQYGINALALLDAYYVTGDAAYLNAAENTAQGILNKDPYATYGFLGYSFDYRFLMRYAAASGNSSYATIAINAWNTQKSLVSRYADGNQEDLYNYFYNSYGSYGAAVWQLSDFGLAALEMGDTAWANNASIVVSNHLSNITSSDEYKVVGWGRALSLLSAVDPVTYAADINTLINNLESSQNADGSWDAGNPEGNVQDTAYAIMGLADAGENDVARQGAHWLVVNQMSNGGWNVPGLGEYSESDAEAVEALYDTQATVTNSNTGKEYYTLQDAIDAAIDGDTIIVHDGVYSPITVDKPLTLKAGSNPVIDASGSAYGIIISADDITIDGFEVIGDASTEAGIVILPGVENVTIKNCIIHGMHLPNLPTSPASYGILAYSNVAGMNPPKNIIIMDNEIYDINMIGISLGGSVENAVISGNYIHDLDAVDMGGGLLLSIGVNIENITDITLSNNNFENIITAINFYGTATISNALVNDGTFTNVGLKITYPSGADVTVTGLTHYAKADYINPFTSTLWIGYFTNIQDAIDNAIDGDTIIVNASTYDEQLIISKSITIEGNGDSTIIRPSQSTADNFQLFSRKASANLPTAAIVVIDQVDSVTLKNLTIDGSQISSVPSGATMFAGILMRGSNGTIDSVNISYIEITNGSGIYITSYDKTVSVEVKECEISSYLKNGITANHEGLTAYIHDNVVTGSGPRGDIAQNGIQIGYGATGTIENNVISDIAYTGSGWTASGILLYNANGTVKENTVTACQYGVDVQTFTTTGTYSASIINNVIDGSGLSGYDGGCYGIASATWSTAPITLTIDGNEIKNYNYIYGSGWYTAAIQIYEYSGDIFADITNNNIQNSGYGIENIYADLNILYNNITQCLYGIVHWGGNIIIHYNNIYDNTYYGLYNNISSVVNATLNYWGDATGPYNETLNPDGQGDGIEGNVDFIPWLDEKKSPVDYANITDISSGTSTINVPDVNAVIDINSAGSNRVVILRYTENPEDNLPGGAIGVGNYIDLSVSNPSSVQYPIYLQINYTAADLYAAGITEDELLGIAYWDGETGCWVLYADTGVNTTNFGNYEGYVWAYIWQNELSPKVIIGGKYVYPTSHLKVTLDPNGYVGDASTFHIWATGSTAWKIKYRIDNGPIKEGAWNKEVQFQLNKNWGYGPGKHTIEYWAIDPGTYEEEHHIETYIMDTKGPSVSISFDGPAEVTSTGIYQIANSTKIILNGYDEESGLKYIMYRIDSGEWNVYTSPFTLPEGYHIVYVVGYDALGNAGDEYQSLIDVGGGKPTTLLQVDPSSPDGNNGWYVSRVRVTLKGYDEASGVAKTMYRIDSGEWNVYTTPFTLGDGKHIIYYYSIDNVGNIEETKSKIIKVDLHPPEIKIDKPLNYIYIFNRALMPIIGNPIIIGKITIVANVVDSATSGVEKGILFIDNKVKQTFDSSLYYTIGETMIGSHILRIEAYDKAGNMAVIEEKIRIINFNISSSSFLS